MKKLFFSRFSLLFAVVAGTLFFGCALSGLDPAGSDAVVTFVLPTPVLSTSDSRAVFSDGMTLYIRSVGGPSSLQSSVFGPYSLSSSTFTTRDFPVGSYDNLAIIAFAQTPTAAMVAAITNATDAEIVADDKTGTSLETFDTMVDGTAVVGFTGKTILSAGENSIAATLQPLCGASGTVSLTGSTTLSGSVSVPTPLGTLRKFYQLELGSVYATWQYMYIQMTANSFIASPSLALYGASGSAVGSVMPSQGRLYLYVSATSGGSIAVSATQALPEITVTGPSTWSGSGLVTVNGATSSSLATGASSYFDYVYPSSSPSYASTHSSTFTIANEGTLPLTLSSVTLSSSGSDWSTTAPTAPVSIPPGGSFSFAITLVYTSAGSKTGTLTIASDDSDEASFIINLTGYASS
jgi:hypothetical protein